MDIFQSTTRFILSILLLCLVLASSCALFNYAYSKKLQGYSLYKSKTFTMSKDVDRQLECLTRNVYYEAATEPFEGKVAVAQVTINRSRSGYFPTDLCKVVYQKNVFYTKVVCQFSWYCEKHSTFKPVHKDHYKESEIVARKVMLEGFELPSMREAMYYHADYVNPHWKKQRISKIGRHIFYK